MVQETAGIRSLFVGTDRSLAERMRRRRWARLTKEFPDLEKMRVLDLGGTATFWARSPVHPVSVTVVNLDLPGEGPSWVKPIQGDACDAAKLVGDQEFDVVFSN